MCIVFEFGILGVDGMGVLLTSTLPRRGVLASMPQAMLRRRQLAVEMVSKRKS